MRISGKGGLGYADAFGVRRSSTTHSANASLGWLGHTTWAIGTFKYDGSHTLKKNGASVSNGTVSGTSVSDSAVTDKLYIGAGNGTSFFTDGDIAEIVIYNTVLSDYKIISIEDELATKYGITLS
jgi:hypothetical protein